MRMLCGIIELVVFGETRDLVVVGLHPVFSFCHRLLGQAVGTFLNGLVFGIAPLAEARRGFCAKVASGCWQYGAKPTSLFGN